MADSDGMETAQTQTQPGVSNPPAAQAPNAARTWRKRGTTAKRRAQRTAAAMRSNTHTVAFRGTDDAHTVAQNPNRAKRSAAPASQREPRTSDRTRTEPRKTLRTWSAKQPALPPIESKNIPRAHGRGQVIYR